jgi:ferredoxin
MKTFYFTTTGNGLAIAKRIEGELYSIPQVLNDSKLQFEDDQIGIIFPCYSFSTPKIVMEFIEKVTLKSSYIFGIMSYGNMAAGGLNHFKKHCEENGIDLAYTNQILMVDNYLPIFDIIEQKKDIPNKNINENIEKITSDVISKKNFIFGSSFLKNTMSNLGNLISNRKSQKFFAKKKFTVEDHCTKCGVCVKVCPVNNIKLEDKISFNDNCIGCLACTHNCPENAIRLKGEKSKERFRNENVTLAEIIKSNEQF